MCCMLQFHIAKGSVAQRTPLPVKLVLPDHSSLLKRLEATAQKLKGTDFAYIQTDSSTVTVTDPWGQVYTVLAPSASSAFDAGIKDITLPCAPGTVAAIGTFYEQVYKVS